MGKSTTGEFGFYVPTYIANLPRQNTWNYSWCIFWAQQMTQGLFVHDERAHELDEEL